MAALALAQWNDSARLPRRISGVRERRLLPMVALIVMWALLQLPEAVAAGVRGASSTGVAASSPTTFSSSSRSDEEPGGTPRGRQHLSRSAAATVHVSSRRRRLDDLDGNGASVSHNSDGTLPGAVRDAFVILASIVAMIAVVVSATYVQVKYCRYYGWGPSPEQRAAAEAGRARRLAREDSEEKDPVLAGMTNKELRNVLRHLLTPAPHCDAGEKYNGTKGDDNDEHDIAADDVKKGSSPPLFHKQRLEDLGTKYHGDDPAEDLTSAPKLSPPGSPVSSFHNNVAGCSICLSAYEPRDIVLRTACSHVFHYDCCLAWLASPRGTQIKRDFGCPYCRATLVSPEQLRDAADRVLGHERVQQLIASRPPKDSGAAEGAADGAGGTPVPPPSNDQDQDG